MADMSGERATLPEAYMDLFERRSFGHLATVMADGSPHVTPVWVDSDGTHVLVNSARGRLKDRNIARRPEVAIDILDPDDPYRYLAVRGRVVEAIDDERADAHIDKLARRYLGVETYPGRNRAPGEVRVIYVIAPERVATFGRRRDG